MSQFPELNEPSSAISNDKCPFKLTGPETNFKLPYFYLHNTKVSTENASLCNRQITSSFMTPLPENVPRTIVKTT